LARSILLDRPGPAQGGSCLKTRDSETRDLALLILVSVIENLGYGQITVWWRVRSFWEYWRGVGGWGQMERRGLNSA
jgi:hypothetical protein